MASRISGPLEEPGPADHHIGICSSTKRFSTARIWNAARTRMAMSR
jgi:hypothetical protein